MLFLRIRDKSPAAKTPGLLDELVNFARFECEARKLWL
jgi:hypothetical protein